MEFSEKLKTLRIEANLTQNELADKLIISRQAISNYEQGRSYPSIDVLVEMSKFFHTSLDELLSSGVRRRHIKYVMVLVGLLFLGNTINLLSIFILMQKTTLPTLYVVFIIAIGIIPFICLLVYLIFQYNPPKRINKFYGYRTKLSMKNQLMWDYAQAYFSLTLAIMAMILLCFAIIYSIVSMFLTLNACLIVGCSFCCVQAISLFFPIYLVEKKLTWFSKKIVTTVQNNVSNKM